jgi:hypothetical protein
MEIEDFMESPSFLAVYGGDSYETSRATALMNRVAAMIKAGSKEAAVVAQKAMSQVNGQAGIEQLEAFLRTHEASFKKVEALKSFSNRNPK